MAGHERVWQGHTPSRHWLLHNKKTCPRCHIPLTKAHLGELDRRSVHCERCQRRYGELARPKPRG